MKTEELVFLTVFPLVFLAVFIGGALNTKGYCDNDKYFKQFCGYAATVGVLAYICLLAYLYK